MPGINTIGQFATLLLGKLAISASRRLRFGGSNLPGRIVLALSPGLLPGLAGQLAGGSILVTGTNGKTTTAALLSHILAQGGYQAISNRSGANLLPGITSAFVGGCRLSGRMGAGIAVLEVDEASVVHVAARVPVRGVIVTNLFRDQLDRFGEVENTLALIARGLQLLGSEAFVLLNTDDPLVASLEQHTKALVIGFGINYQGGDAGPDRAADIRNCLRCGEELVYTFRHYAHLGLYRCPRCGYRRPLPAYYMISRRQRQEGDTAGIMTPQGFLPVRIALPGFYNLYNILAALSCALHLGVERQLVREALQQFTPSFGRMENMIIGRRCLRLALIKNPAGANEVLRTLNEAGGSTALVLAINDRYADGTDISWLWDVDFECLASLQRRIGRIYCTGTRAEDMALRLKYAGLAASGMITEPDLVKCISQVIARTPAGVIQVLPTYTALLELRKAINKMGYGKRFWEV